MPKGGLGWVFEGTDPTPQMLKKSRKSKVEVDWSIIPEAKSQKAGKALTEDMQMWMPKFRLCDEPYHKSENRAEKCLVCDESSNPRNFGHEGACRMPQNINSGGGRFFGRLSAAGSEAEEEILRAAATVKIKQDGLPIIQCIITAGESTLARSSPSLLKPSPISISSPSPSPSPTAIASAASDEIISSGGCLLGAGPQQQQQPKQQQQQQPVLRREPKQQHHVLPQPVPARATTPPPSILATPHPSHSIVLSCTPPSGPSPLSLFPVTLPSPSESHSPRQTCSPTAASDLKDHDPTQTHFAHQDHPHLQDIARKRNAFLDMLAWLRGDQQGEDEEIDQDLIIDQQEELEPETPGPAAFAFNAFRTGLFGTPKPNLEAPERERQPRPRLGREVMSDEDVFTSSRKRQSSRSPGRFLTFEDAVTPTRRNPQSILVTPGNTISKKKTVSFGPDQFHEDTICYETRTGRIRSGLPSSYPGKFPSPWTPKVTNDFPKKRAKEVQVRADDIEIFEDQAKPLKSAQKSKLKLDKDAGRDQVFVISRPKEEVKSVDEQIHALRENTARINDMIGEAAEAPVHDGDVTVNLDEPRSRSGVYWKERYSTDISQAEKKVEFYKARKDTTVEFASKKDEQCANLAARLKEEMELRRKMQAEIDRWQKLAMEHKHEPVTTINAPVSESYQQKTIERLRKETAEYREIIRQKEVEMNDHEYQLDRQRSEIDRQARRIKDLEAALKARKEAANEASASSANAESEVRTLKRELRKAEVAASGKDLLQTKYEGSQREVERLRQQLALVKEENQRLKFSQKSAHTTTLAALDQIPIVTTVKETRPIEPVVRSHTRETRPPPPPPSPESPEQQPRHSPKITEQSAFPNINLVDSKPQIGGIFSNPAPLPRIRDVIPAIDETLREEDEGDSSAPLPGQSKPDDFKPAPKPFSPIKSTPNPRKPTLSRTPIMTEKEIMDQLESTDLSLPPFSPTMGSMSDIDLDKLKAINKPAVRRSKEDLINGNKQIGIKSASTDRPRTSEETPRKKPMADPGPPKYDTDNETFRVRRSTTSPMPKMFNFEKTPDRRGSLTSLRNLVNTKIIRKPSAFDMGANPALLKTTAAAATSDTTATGVAITATKASPSDTDARRQLAAAKMAEMKARMKAANKEARN
ncbi:hypothetical protein Dda_0997 [Drechslerella dactyloides]|uniref:Spindle pole body-associated protein cut12 domain-containing protein n=1 Tax=Drechslerella dactyloides TaxID=74499 RepID=A0AAD6J755_DREDA|nr:hypothetical protein Dda_0997 [Drechslerella dactyloides]